MKFEALTDKIIGNFYEVHEQLGYGFLEKHYQTALLLELEENDLSVEK